MRLITEIYHILTEIETLLEHFIASVEINILSEDAITDTVVVFAIIILALRLIIEIYHTLLEIRTLLEHFIALVEINVLSEDVITDAVVVFAIIILALILITEIYHILEKIEWLSKAFIRSEIEKSVETVIIQTCCENKKTL